MAVAWALWTIVMMVLPACLKMSDARSPPLTASGPSGAGVAASDSTTPPIAGSPLDLGAGLEVTAAAPGRFANAIQKNTNARHAMQVIRGDATSSFVLNLDPDGTATVCRGWRYLFFNDGPDVHVSEQIREQLGYRGRWKRRGDEVDVDVRLAEDVCTRVGQYNHLVPSHATEWHLRCLLVTPRNHPTLATPALVCRTPNAEPVLGEDEPHTVPAVLPGHWLVLGPGNGLRIKMQVRSVAGGKPPIVQVEPSRDRIEADAWEHPF
jgi:hypothetical protein